MNLHISTFALRRFVISFLLVRCPYQYRSVKFHGGDPSANTGTCTCGVDGYCLCTPSLAVDAILEVYAGGDGEPVPSFVLVKRKVPPLDVYAIPGGFVNIGESVADAALRETREETAIKVRPRQCRHWTVRSDPGRDKRRHTVSAVQRCLITNTQLERMKGLVLVKFLFS